MLTDMKQDALIKDKISEAFISSKKSIDEYISVIEKTVGCALMKLYKRKK